MVQQQLAGRARPVFFIIYYMANSVNGQDEPSPSLSLATRVGKMALSCPVRLREYPLCPESGVFALHGGSKWLDNGLVL